MILDSIADSSSYEGIHANLDTALKFLREVDTNTLTDGRHEIDGDEVYAMVQTYETTPAAEKRFEAHRAYADIQYVASGSEIIYWQRIDRLSPDGSYDADKDCAFYADGECVPLPLSAGDFTVLFPQDAHKPGCNSAPIGSVRKIVVKCRIAAD